MSHLKYLLPVLIITLSCNPNKGKKGASIDSTKTTITSKSSDSSSGAVIDSSDLNEASEESEERIYPYDTIIKGGYSLSYRYDSTDQYLIYKKGNTIIDTIGGGSLGIRYKSIGYVGADFDNCFVFVNSFGSANPHYIKILDKATAKKIMPEGTWIDVDKEKQILLYSRSDVPEPGDSMTLFDAKKMTYKDYAFPQEIFDGPEKLNRISLVKVTEQSFTIEYTYNENSVTKRKEYQR